MSELCAFVVSDLSDMLVASPPDLARCVSRDPSGSTCSVCYETRLACHTCAQCQCSTCGPCIFKTQVCACHDSGDKLRANTWICPLCRLHTSVGLILHQCKAPVNCIPDARAAVLMAWVLRPAQTATQMECAATFRDSTGALHMWVGFLRPDDVLPEWFSAPSGVVVIGSLPYMRADAGQYVAGRGCAFVFAHGRVHELEGAFELVAAHLCLARLVK